MLIVNESCSVFLPLQVQDGVLSKVPKYRGTVHALATIFRTEGFGTLYAGLTPNLTGSMVEIGRAHV